MLMEAKEEWKYLTPWCILGYNSIEKNNDIGIKLHSQWYLNETSLLTWGFFYWKEPRS